MATPLGITLPIGLGANGYFSTTTNPQIQIRSNLTNLLLTKRGERPFQPTFGCDIPKSFFESNTDQSLAEIQAEIQTSISDWMPFIRVDGITVHRDSLDSHDATVTIAYTILTTNTQDSIRLVF